MQRKILTSPRQLGIVAACFRGGQPRDGVQEGPTEIFRAGFVDQLSANLNYHVQGDTHETDYRELRPAVGQDESYRGMRNPRLVSAVTKVIAEKAYNHVMAGRLVITLGGDHSIGIGSVGGVAKAVSERLEEVRPLAVIWVDAHADLNTPEDSLSGNIHGMPLAFLTGLATSNRMSIFDWLTSEHRIAFAKLVYIGLRDVDDSEKKTIRDRHIKAFSINEVERHGINEIIDQTLAHIGSYAPIHLVFDIDGLDPYWALSTGMPVEHGLSLRDACVIAERLHQSGQVVAIDLVEINPLINPAGACRTIQSGISVVKSALGGHFV